MDSAGRTGHVKRWPVLQLTWLFLAAHAYPQQPVPNDPLLRWMDRIAQKELDARDAVIANIKTVADAEQRKKVVREKLMEIMGGLPNYKGPLNARITGAIHTDGFVIEKVIYESLPGYFVTANV